MKMNAILSFSLCLSVAVAGWALPANAEVPSGFDSQAWHAWLDHVVTSGTHMDTPVGEYIVVSKINPEDKTISHQADYFSTVGHFDLDGKYFIDRIEDVSEQWIITPDGTREIDQWIFVVSREGDVRKITHTYLVENPEGLILKDEDIHATPEEGMARWVTQLNFWYAVTSGGPGEQPAPMAPRLD